MSIESQIQMLRALHRVSDEAVYAACRVNGSRRATDWQMAHRYEALRRIAERIQPFTVRGCFYQAASVHHLVPKTDSADRKRGIPNGYDMVQRALLLLRQCNVIPYGWITDSTRWQMKPTTYNGVADMLKQTAKLYRRAVWTEVGVHIEFWLEKDALAGLIHPVTEEYDVPLMVARGFSSETFLHSAGEYIRENKKPAYIYHLGDHDPSGVSAARHIERKLRKFSGAVPVYFERLAVLPEQVEKWNLPTRPTKPSDTRSRNWHGDSVELDAINPHELRAMVKAAIEQHLPAGRLEILKKAEESERQWLESWANIITPPTVQTILSGMPNKTNEEDLLRIWERFMQAVEDDEDEDR